MLEILFYICLDDIAEEMKDGEEKRLRCTVICKNSF